MKSIGLSFLIVDDHAPMRRALRELITTAADEVREAADGAQAEIAYEEQRPDWVIMDVQMQPVGGLAATRNITARYPGARIVIVTQFDDPDLRAGARDAGALAYLTKDNLFALQSFIHAPAVTAAEPLAGVVFSDRSDSIVPPTFHAL